MAASDQVGTGASADRRPLVSGNWKMHHDHIAALHLLRDLGFRLDPADADLVEVSVHPPFCDLRTVQSVVEDRELPLSLGAQHCSEHDQGAYTGEVAPGMLARLGVHYVLVGHSERRQLFAMTDRQVAATVRAVLAHHMVPVLCVGETEEQRDQEATEQVLAGQLAAAVGGLDPQVVEGLVLAYEPIWAIGSGRAATPDDAQAACGYLRHQIAELANQGAAERIRIQYGGSVNHENAADLVERPDVDGLLVGGASLEAESFTDVIRSVAACYRARGAA